VSLVFAIAGGIVLGVVVLSALVSIGEVALDWGERRARMMAQRPLVWPEKKPLRPVPRWLQIANEWCALLLPLVLLGSCALALSR
jgi:hypothetical protein